MSSEPGAVARPLDGAVRPVAVVGLAERGRALVPHLRRSGAEVTAYDDDAGRAAAASTSGALRAGSAAGAARRAGVVVLALPDTAAVRHALFESLEPIADEVPRDAVVVDTSPTGPRASRLVAAELDRRGLRYVEASLSGTPRQAVAGSLTTHAGGEVEVIELVRGVLESWSAPGRVVHTGGHGTGNAATILASLSLAMVAEVVGEALRLGRDLGLGREVCLDVLTAGGTESFVARRGHALGARDSGHDDHHLAMVLDHFQAGLSHAGAALPAAEAAYLLARLAVAEGLGDRDVVELALRREGLRELDAADRALLDRAARLTAGRPE